MHFIGSKQFASHKYKVLLLRRLAGESKFVHIKTDTSVSMYRVYSGRYAATGYGRPKALIPAFTPYLRIRKPAVCGAKGRYAESSYKRVCRFYEMIPRSTRHSVRHLTYEDK